MGKWREFDIPRTRVSGLLHASAETYWESAGVGLSALEGRGGEKYVSCRQSNCAAPSLVTTLTSVAVTCTDLEQLNGGRGWAKLDSAAHYRHTDIQTQ